MGDQRIRVSESGVLSFAPPELKARFAANPGEYLLHEGPNGAFLMMRAALKQEASKAGGRILMMGELVHRMNVVEIINLVMSSNWRGELHLVGPAGRRVLSIDQGALKHARTDFEPERLGEILVRAGLLERTKLAPLLAQKPADKRIGQLLVERGLVTQEALFKQLQYQTEVIFNGALLEERGLYWFVTPRDDAESPAATVHLSIQGLLMEGVQQIDEMGLFRERIPHNGLFPMATPNAAPAKLSSLDQSARELLALSDGTRSIDDLARATSLAEFPTLKAVYGLLRGGLVQLRRGPRLDPKTAQRLVREFNTLVRDIFMVVATYGRMDATRRALATWLKNSAHAAVLGEEVDIDGTLDAAEITRKLEQGTSDDPMNALHKGLHELIAYALFTASAGLPRSEEQTLARDINARLKQIQL